MGYHDSSPLAGVQYEHVTRPPTRLHRRLPRSSGCAPRGGYRAATTPHNGHHTTLHGPRPRPRPPHRLRTRISKDSRLFAMYGSPRCTLCFGWIPFHGFPHVLPRSGLPAVGRNDGTNHWRPRPDDHKMSTSGGSQEIPRFHWVSPRFALLGFEFPWGLIRFQRNS